PVNAVDTLVVPQIALYVAKVQVAQTKAPVALIVSQTQQPIGNDSIFTAELGAIPVAALTDLEGLTCQTDTHAHLGDCTLCHLAALRWLHHFFSMASLSTSALRRSSAYIFFRRRFSSSSSFNRAIIEASIPPNLARHL